MRSIGIGLSAWVFSIACATHAEAALRPFRFEELAKVERIGGFEVSPDGKWIAYAVGTPVIAENRVKSAIWLAPAAGGAPRPLTSGDKRDSDPAFSPDGRRVAFLSNRDGSSQIWTIGLSGGEPSKATSFRTTSPVSARPRAILAERSTVSVPRWRRASATRRSSRPIRISRRFAARRTSARSPRS
jgi:dipeptidyl aminopeptidase/acylaminoacyl peptidase